MLRRVCLVAWAFLLPCLAPSVLSAQTSAAPTNSVLPAEETDLAELLNRGRALEQDRRWGEALTLYEDALRLHPNQRGLEQRLQLSRIHYDLSRRYSDRSFRQSLRSMSARVALDLYEEVLKNIQSHYVETPDWKRLLDHGTTGLEVALGDSLFVEANLRNVPQGRIDHFRRRFRTQLTSDRVASRYQARDVVALAGRIGREQLGLPDAVVVHEFICGATNALDPYSTFLTAGQLDEVYSQIEGNFVGLGVELKSDRQALLITKVIPGSPAQRGGIRAGDRIVAVDGRSTAELTTDQAANLLQGKAGSYVEVTAVGADERPRRVRVRREHVEVPSIDETQLVDPQFGIAYLKLTCFQKTTSHDLDVALSNLSRRGMRSLIVDLRGNPGGLLTTAVDVVDKFVDRGTIVSTRGRSRQEDFTYAAQEAGTWKLPLVVLIDGESASASEIFAGAIRDFGRGTLVGSRSYGKGSVQGIFPLNTANAGLRLTTAKFYSPKGRAYSGVGVEPHIHVPHRVARPDFDAQQPPEQADDDALDAAVAELRRQLVSRN